MATPEDHYGHRENRVTTCLENLEMSGNLTAVRKCHEFNFTKSLGSVRGKTVRKVSVKSCLKLFIVSCIFVSIHEFSTSMGMI